MTFSWIKIIGMIAALAAVIGACVYLYQQGKNAGIDQANTKIAQYEQKISDLNAELLKKQIVVTERVITEYHNKETVRTQIEYKNRDIIHTVVPKQFNLSKGWIYAHDQSALGLEINPALASNPAPSNVSDVSALSVVSDNYNKSNRTADQLESLQQYIREVGIPVTNEKATNRTK